MMKINKLVTYVFTILMFCAFTSCNKHFTKFPLFKKTKQIQSKNNLPPINFNTPQILISISTIDRENPEGDGGYKWIPYANVFSYKKSTFNFIKTYIQKIEDVGKYSIKYKGSNKNDSIYKSIVTDTFKYLYNHLYMQSIPFTNKNDGLYLVVTYIISKSIPIGGGGGIGGGGAGISSNTLYEFFEVNNGVSIAYSGFSVGKDDSFRRMNQKGFPKYNDLDGVLKKMIKQSKKFYAK